MFLRHCPRCSRLRGRLSLEFHRTGGLSLTGEQWVRCAECSLRYLTPRGNIREEIEAEGVDIASQFH